MRNAAAILHTVLNPGSFTCPVSIWDMSALETTDIFSKARRVYFLRCLAARSVSPSLMAAIVARLAYVVKRRMEGG